jgi:hypothetical protein
VRMIEPDKLRVTLSYDATVADVVDARRPRA